MMSQFVVEYAVYMDEYRLYVLTSNYYRFVKTLER